MGRFWVTIVTNCLLADKDLWGMKANMGSLDRILRVLIAVVIAALYFTGVIPGTLGIVLMVLAAVFALTSAVSVCPLYMPFRFSTKKK